ncbi:MAG: hypothetical protein Q4E54_07245 [Lachnospiraceae bacterium]|nr:hypothetical protein [Lachnospiraceae bacterium]
MEKKENSILGLVMSIIALILLIIMLFIGSNPVTKYLYIAASVLAAVFAIIYFIKGGTKKAAIWRNLFCILLMISLLISIIRNIQLGKGAADTICIIIVAVITGYLAFAKDLGKKKSLGLASAVVVLQLLQLMPVITAQSGDGATRILGIISTTLLVITLLDITYVKYYDKESRKGVEE